MVIQHMLHLYRAEGAQPYMEGYPGNTHPHGLYLGEKGLGKVEACRRRGGRTFMAGLYRLVSALILQLVGNIGRKGHLPQLVQDFLENPIIVKLDQPIPLLQGIDDLSS